MGKKDQDWDDESRMGIASLLEEKIAGYQPFQDSITPFPINEILLGELAPDKLREQLQDMVSSSSLDPHGLVHLLAWMELLMAANGEEHSNFIRDNIVRAMLLSLNDKTGWALLYGNPTQTTVDRLRVEKIEIVPVDKKPSLIRFVQFILRYPFIYGKIPKGDLHKLEHFLEDHAPLVILICRRLDPLEKLLVQACRTLGIPVISAVDWVPEIGGIIQSKDEDEMIEMVMQLPNLRIRRRRNQILSLPFECDPINLNEDIDESKCWGGDEESFFVVRNLDSGDGFETTEGDGKTIGVVVDIGDAEVDLLSTVYLEKVIAQFPSYIKGVHSRLSDRKPKICWQPGMGFQPRHLAQVLYEILKTEFMVDKIKVRILFDEHIPPDLRTAATEYKDKREKHLKGLTEENSDFLMCVRCHSFALEHACFVTPERPGICGSKSYDQIRTSAILDDMNTTTLFKWNIRSLVIDKGKCLDPDKGEYLGVNKAIRQVTDGKVERVNIHSIAEFPPTSCSCFAGVAFFLKSTDGIGIMHRSFKGISPDGRSWNDLAAEAGGKQGSRIAGMALSYMNSKKFLQGDGGWDSVFWMPKTLLKKYAPEGYAIATEEDARSIEELESFLKSHNRLDRDKHRI